MREKNENTFRETEPVFVFAVLLLNFLVFTVVCGIVRLLQLLISLNSPPSAALGETIWR